MSKRLMRLREAEIIKRKTYLPKVIAPIAAKRDKVKCDSFSTGQSLALGMYDGIARPNRYTDGLFNTTVDRLAANYFELWSPLDGDLYFLEQAYLNIYEMDKDKRPEFICLHADPCIAQAEVYKRGPHLHIKCAPTPLPKAHLPLNLSNIEEILRSPETFTQYWKAYIKMLAEEVLDRF